MEEKRSPLGQPQQQTITIITQDGLRHHPRHRGANVAINSWC